MTEPEIGAGDVIIVLDGTEQTLRPSLQACTALASRKGGITGLVSQCLEYNFDAIQSVVLAGLGGKGWKTLPDDIFKAGLIKLAPDCIKFLHIVANGGQPIGADEDDDEAGGKGSPLANSSQ